MAHLKCSHKRRVMILSDRTVVHRSGDQSTCDDHIIDLKIGDRNIQAETLFKVALNVHLLQPFPNTTPNTKEKTA